MNRVFVSVCVCVALLSVVTASDQVDEVQQTLDNLNKNLDKSGLHITQLKTDGNVMAPVPEVRFMAREPAPTEPTGKPGEQIVHNVVTFSKSPSPTVRMVPTGEVKPLTKDQAKEKHVVTPLPLETPSIVSPPQPVPPKVPALNDVKARLAGLGWLAAAESEPKNPSDHLIQQTLANMKKIEAADVGPMAPGNTVEYTHKVKFGGAIKQRFGGSTGPADKNSPEYEKQQMHDRAVRVAKEIEAGRTGANALDEAPAQADRVHELAKHLIERSEVKDTTDPVALREMVHKFVHEAAEAPASSKDAQDMNDQERKLELVKALVREAIAAHASSLQPGAAASVASKIAKEMGLDSIEALGKEGMKKRIGEDGPQKRVVAAALTKLSSVADSVSKKVARLDTLQADMMRKISGKPAVNDGSERDAAAKQLDQEALERQIYFRKKRREAEIAALTRNEVRVLTDQMYTNLKELKQSFFAEIKEMMINLRKSLHSEFLRSKERQKSLETGAESDFKKAVGQSKFEESLISPVREKQQLDLAIAHKINAAFNKMENIRRVVLQSFQARGETPPADFGARPLRNEPPHEALQEAVAREADLAREQAEKQMKAEAETKKEGSDAKAAAADAVEKLNVAEAAAQALKLAKQELADEDAKANPELAETKQAAAAAEQDKLNEAEQGAKAIDNLKSQQLHDEQQAEANREKEQVTEELKNVIKAEKQATEDVTPRTSLIEKSARTKLHRHPQKANPAQEIFESLQTLEKKYNIKV